MQIRNTLLVAASAVLAVAEDVTLFIKSDNSEVNGNSISFYHEGAGISYGFLGTSAESITLSYDESTGSLLDTNSGFTFPIPFGVSNNFVQVSVLEPGATFSFDGNTLLANGTGDVFYACKNVNDPYRYSEKSYALMYYPSDAPTDCIPVNIVNRPGAASSALVFYSSSSTTLESSSATPSSTGTISSFTGAGANIAPAGAFAAIAGIAAALI